MKIAFILDWHTESMGYSDNFLSKAMAALGHELHLITTERQVFFNSRNAKYYRTVFEPFLGPGKVACGTKKTNGYYLHRLRSSEFRGKIFIHGLEDVLRNIQPDIVQAGEFTSLSTYQVAWLKSKFKYKLFVECHIHASVFPPSQKKKVGFAWRLYARTIGAFLNRVIEKCFPISLDSAEIVEKFLGIEPEKIVIRSLGVDTDLFMPVNDAQGELERTAKRMELGFLESEVVSIYTGRLSPEKDPLCLAKATEILRKEGLPFRALLMGNGAPSYMEQLTACDGVEVHPFVPANELPGYYRAADIGVWPKQESTSQLDAAATGLPIILSDHVVVLERVEGNGLVFKQDDPQDLAEKLRSLANADTRKAMGLVGAKKMRDIYSWEGIAREYEKDYREALQSGA